MLHCHNYTFKNPVRTCPLPLDEQIKVMKSSKEIANQMSDGGGLYNKMCFCEGKYDTTRCKYISQAIFMQLIMSWSMICKNK